MQAIDGGRTARRWIRESLSQGAVLSHAVLESVDLRAGDAVALLPEGYRGEGLPDPETGCRVDGEARSALLDTLVQALLPSVGLLIVEDDTARIGDPGFDDDQTLVRLDNERVAHRRVIEGATPFDLEKFIRFSSTGYPANGFIVANSHARNAEGQELVDHVVKHLVAVIVAAFDGDSWILWSVSHLKSRDRSTLALEE